MLAYHVDLLVPPLYSGEADDLFRFPPPPVFMGCWTEKEKHGGQDCNKEIKSTEQREKSDTFVLRLIHSSRKKDGGGWK